jgi:activator of HSP90 ATPase
MSLELKIQFGVPAPVIYKALLDEFDMSKTTRTKAQITPKVGGTFNLYEGRIQGEYTKLEENKTIEQKWKMNDWADHSNVVMTFVDYEEDSECEVIIKQTGLPSNIKPDFMKQGWMSQIFRPMSLICGYPIMNN